MTSHARAQWLLVLLSAALQVLIFPSPGIFFLAWIALAPLLVALAREQRPQRAFLLSYACGVLWYGGTCYWIFHVMNSYGGLPKPVAAGVLVLFCLYLGLYHALFGILFSFVARRGVVLALGLAPCLWVAVELARARVTGFPWDLLGYAQVENIALTSLAPVTGVYGLSFVIAAVNAAVAAAWLRGSRNLVTGALLAAAVLQAEVLYRPAPSPAAHTARLVQQNIPIYEPGTWTAEFYDNTLARLVELSRGAKVAPRAAGDTDHSQHGGPGSAAPQALADPATKLDLIIWPESPAPFYTSDPKFHHWLAALAADANAFVVAGSLGVRSATSADDLSQMFNSAVVVGPAGDTVARYDKIHLVPFGEYVPYKSLFRFADKLTREVGEYSSGKERTVFRLNRRRGSQSVGVFICYESIFGDEVRMFARGGAQVLVNISNDGWFGRSGAPGQHLNMARMRAIENRRWLLRATNTGITASIDPLGRVVAHAETGKRLAVDVPYALSSHTTFYTRFGDLFAWACAIIALAALLYARFRLRAAD